MSKKEFLVHNQRISHLLFTMNNWIQVLIPVFYSLDFWFFYQGKQEREELRAEARVIQKQVNQVGKLIVTEGYYSKVFTFKNSQNLFLNLFSSDKKALVVVNTKATVEYDLRQLEVEINEASWFLKNSEPVLNIYPEIEYYDVTQDYFNAF
ncbi:MAG: DUF4230 domain-containing protein [Arcicella sp.]|nr:DUF4230 domain-containing protein [Arcicella sp.]